MGYKAADRPHPPHGALATERPVRRWWGALSDEKASAPIFSFFSINDTFSATAFHN